MPNSSTERYAATRFRDIDNLNIVFIIVSTTVLAGGHTQKKLTRSIYFKSEILGRFAFEYVLERYFLFES